MANTESPAPSTLTVAARASGPAEGLRADVDLRGMLIGTASAALQIEGGDDNNDWVDWARRPGTIADGSSPLRAADHWRRWREDNELMASLQLPIARIGVEWARIEPRPGEFDHAVLDRYREEIGDLVDKGIRPLVTLHHFVNPRWFIARFLVTTGNSVALFYLFYYLRDHIGHADPDAGVLILTGAYAVCVVVTAIVSGKASDASGKRRPFVAQSSMGVAAACAVMAVAGSFVTVIVAAILLGLSWGVFMAVDQALINQVLPKADERGRDLGVMNLAVAGPNVAAPVLAAFALANLGGYPGLYVFAGVLTVIGAGLVYLVRGVP